MVSNECLLALIGNHGSNLSIVLHMKLEKKCGSMVPNQFPLVTDWEVWIQKKKSRACVYSVYPKIMNHGSMGPHFPISTSRANSASKSLVWIGRQGRRDVRIKIAQSLLRNSRTLFCLFWHFLKRRI